jgi:hypothetical protein
MIVLAWILAAVIGTWALIVIYTRTPHGNRQAMRLLSWAGAKANPPNRADRRRAVRNKR